MNATACHEEPAAYAANDAAEALLRETLARIERAFPGARLRRFGPAVSASPRRSHRGEEPKTPVAPRRPPP
jgi:hypothetical protein